MSRLPGIVRMRPRLILAIAAAIASYALEPATWPASARLLLAWDAGLVLYLALILTMMGRSTVDSLRHRAKREDEGAVGILVLAATATVASLGAIGVELAGLHDIEPGNTANRLALAATTIGLSWLFLHTVFAIHYAHEFHSGKTGISALGFPDSESPDYWDFMYFAFTIGATAQTSDIGVVTRRMRRLVLGHSILAFVFNTCVLALAVNVGASLL
jgi:uncharacterized membrane protein